MSSTEWFDVTAWFTRAEDHLKDTRADPPTAVSEVMERAGELRDVAKSMRAYATDARVRADETDVKAAEREALADDLLSLVSSQGCRGYRLDDPIHLPGSRPGSNCPICESGDDR